MLKRYNVDKFLNEYLSLEDSVDLEIKLSVEKICNDVKDNKDAALYKYTKMYDKVALESLIVTKEEMKEAFNSVSEKWINALENAKENIESYHNKQLEKSWFDNTTEGVIRGEVIRPLEKVGIYVPGGTAAYPSSVLMTAVPAKVAGVSNIVMTTPPQKDGSIPSETLVAASIAGVNEIYKVGGAQAVAAMAYGTESVTKVDKIVGPGNIYVTEAKRFVYGDVGIDMLAGPSEVCIYGDQSAHPSYVASDLLAQAEHDTLARVVFITNDNEIANAVNEELEKQLQELPRNKIARESINRGAYVVVDSIDQATVLINKMGPEHLEIAIDNPFDFLDRIKNAGSIFLGHYAAESLGDYYAGVNHVLPTSGTSRFSSMLSVRDYYTVSGVLYYTKDALKSCSEEVITLAESEKLTGHARAVEIRVKNE
ncbi:MAG: histidinol dehydrogenase [Clostridia bacterium]